LEGLDRFAVDKEMSIDLEGLRLALDPFGITGGGIWRFSSLRGSPGESNQLLGILIESLAVDSHGDVARPATWQRTEC
jgi:hypothetical protein